jgi:hypothetical protein
MTIFPKNESKRCTASASCEHTNSKKSYKRDVLKRRLVEGVDIKLKSLENRDSELKDHRVDRDANWL